MQSQHSRTRALALLLALTLVGWTAFPQRAAASTDPGQERAKVRQERARAAAQLDSLKAQESEVTAALDSLDDYLTAQRDLAERASRAQAEAAQAAAEAEKAEQQKVAEIAQLETEARNAAVAMYMGQTSSGLAAFLPGEDVSTAISRSALSELALGGAESSIDRLDTVREDLAAARARAESTEQEAAHRREHAEQQSRDLAEAIALSEQKQAELEDRVEQNLAESASLASIDARLSKQIAEREAALAAELRKSQERTRAQGGTRAWTASSGGSGGAPIIAAEGNLVVVRGVKVDASIAGALSRLMDAAAASGFSLGGGGYRSAEAQIAVRRNNCGTSQYAIWQMPASQCNPPAARPGTSMHERGLAVDFTCNGALISSYSSSCYRWLEANAPGFGFRNRPGEAWHWSPTGN